MTPADFRVGVAVFRSIVTGPRRTVWLVAQETELAKARFNQITAENDLKWQLTHPREGADGYDFGGVGR